MCPSTENEKCDLKKVRIAAGTFPLNPIKLACVIVCVTITHTIFKGREIMKSENGNIYTSSQFVFAESNLPAISATAGGRN